MSKYPNSEMEGYRAVTTVSALASKGRVHHPYTPMTLALALLTTMTSVGIAIMSGLQRAVGHPQQAACVALSVAAVAGAHLLPALGSGKSLSVRFCAMFLCVASLLVTLYGQANFFLQTQQSAGNQRATSASSRNGSQQSSPEPARSLVTIAEDEERIRSMLATNDARRCDENCLAQHRRHDLLDARLHRLATEEYEAKRQEVQADRRADSAERLRDSMREDAATARLARAIGRDEQTLNLLLALLCACVLDFTGSFCWYLIFQRSRRREVTNADLAVAFNDLGRHERVVPDDGPIPDSGAQISDEVDDRLTQLLHDVAAGRVRPTVDGIRAHFNCAQRTATQLRRRYRAVCEAIPSTTSQS